MAAPLKRLGICAFNCAARTRPHPRISLSRPSYRLWSNSVPRQSNNDEQSAEDVTQSQKDPSSTDSETPTEVSAGTSNAQFSQEAAEQTSSGIQEADATGKELGQDSNAAMQNTGWEEDMTEELSTDDAVDEETPSVSSSSSYDPEDESTANSILMGLLGVKSFKPKAPEAAPPKEKPFGEHEIQLPYFEEESKDIAEQFKYGEFGDDFDHIRPAEPDAELRAYVNAVEELKTAMDGSATNSEVTERLRQVKETQKALQEANKEWGETFSSAVGEEVFQHWEEAINELDEDDWDKRQNEWKQMEKNMLAREPESPGYWNMGEENQGLGDDEEFRNDDLTPMGHAELEQHREIREYARIAAWEMPLLTKLARPFEVPTAASPLRFRYTTYMGEQHPAARKVVVDFSPSDLPNLTSQQKAKLIKIAGARYNPSTDRIKMSCESYEHPAQNKRYLSDLVDKLIVEAKDQKDTFEDVPFDFRHHKPKPVFEFPESWKITKERQAFLTEQRKLAIESSSEEQNVVDGLSVITEATRAPPSAAKVPVLVAVGAGKKGGSPTRKIV